MAFVKKIETLFASRMARNLTWQGGAELVNRVFRLAATVTLARFFTKTDYGMVSAIYTVFEFALTLSLSTGIAAKVIQTETADLEPLCDTVYWMNWILCGSLFLLQCGLAYPIAQFYGNTRLVWPICTLGLIYLIFPNFLVQEALIRRENRLEVIAACISTQAVVANLLLVGFVLSGFGIWSIVLSMLISYPPSWLWVTHRNHAWRPPRRFTVVHWRSVIDFSSKIFGVELLNRIRLNIDYLIVAKFLGLEALGLYFFAFNAGLGISQSVVQGLTNAWYPDFCEVRRDRVALQHRYIRSLKTVGLTVLPIVVIQSCLAIFYVPIIFGPKWMPGVPMLIILCLSAVPFALYQAASQLLKSVDRVQIDLIWSLCFVGLFSLTLLLVQPMGLRAIAIAVTVTQATLMPAFAIWVGRLVFKGRSTPFSV